MIGHSSQSILHSTSLIPADEGVVRGMVGQVGALQPLVAGMTGAFHRLALQWLALHKGVAKLGYIVTSLLSGVIQEGYCTASEEQEAQAGERCAQTFMYRRLHTIFCTHNALYTQPSMNTCMKGCRVFGGSGPGD